MSIRASSLRTRGGLRTTLLCALLACGLPGCALFGGADPMRAELERLGAEQERLQAEQRELEDAEALARAEQPPSFAERLARGDSHLAAGRIAAAVWDYGAAHRLEPEAPEPRVRLGYLHLRHDPERARPLFESALEHAPDDADAHIGLGLALLAAGEALAGVEHLERAVELAPDSSAAHAALGVGRDQRGEHAAAVAQLERARDLSPRDGRILNNLGVAYLRVGAPQLAESVLREALRQDRRDEALRANNLGLALALQGRSTEALEAFRRGGDEQGALSNLGYAHHLQGEFARAIELYEQALVEGGEADLQVLHNLEAARRGSRAVRRPAARPVEAPLAGAVSTPLATGEGAVRPAPPPPAAGSPLTRGLRPGGAATDPD